MAKSPLPSISAERRPAPLPKPAQSATTAQLVERLSRARTVNEMSVIVGLKPIKGRSGPKVAY